MKIKITLKDPDTMHEAVIRAVSEQLGEVQGVSSRERDLLLEERVEEQKAKLKKWFRYDEYLTIECDTETGTAIVLPA